MFVPPLSFQILASPTNNIPPPPLKWPQWRKELILLITSLSAAVVGAYGPMLSPGFVQVASDLHISVNVLAESTAWLILCIGLGLFITNPLAKIIGRRPVYMAAVIIMFATCVWGAAVKDYDSFLAGRIVAGIGMAPFEVLVQCTIGDMYFVHERATRIAVWNMFLLTGISGGALVAGYIIEREGYRWTFGVCAIFFGVLMLAVVFLVPETAYRREDPVAPVPVPVPVPVNEKPLEEEGSGEGLVEGEEVNTFKPGGGRTGATEKKHTYWQSLRVYTGRYSRAPGWKPFVRPAVLLFYPAVFWGFLVYGQLYSPGGAMCFCSRTNFGRNRHHLDRRVFCC